MKLIDLTRCFKRYLTLSLTLLLMCVSNAFALPAIQAFSGDGVVSAQLFDIKNAQGGDNRGLMIREQTDGLYEKTRLSVVELNRVVV